MHSHAFRAVTARARHTGIRFTSASVPSQTSRASSKREQLARRCTFLPNGREITQRVRVALSVALAFVVTLTGACGDGDSPTASQPLGPDRVVPPSTRVEEQPESDSLLRRVIEELGRDIDAGRDEGRIVAWTTNSAGTARALTASQLHDELQTALQDKQQQRWRDRADTNRRQTFASPIFSDPKLALKAYGVVQVSGSHFHFYSISDVNRTDQVFHRMRATTKVVAVGENGAQTNVYERRDSASFYETGGYATRAWDEVIVSSGCSFLGTTSTDNEVQWPATGYVPSGIVYKANTSGVGSATMWKSCTKPTTPPPPPPSEPLCDDDSAAVCEKPSSGGGGPYSGGTMTREIGQTTRHKIMCEVTDWYENGVYIETTINRCWTEPIW